MYLQCMTKCHCQWPLHSKLGKYPQQGASIISSVPQSTLNMLFHTSQKYLEQESDDFNNEHVVPGVMGNKEVYCYKWHTYYFCHDCINTMKQCTCIAKNTYYSMLQYGLPDFVCKVCNVSLVYILYLNDALLPFTLSSCTL